MIHTDLRDPQSNTPSAWTVVKHGERSWWLMGDHPSAPIDTFTTRRDAEAALTDGWARRAWEQEHRWMTEGTYPGWRPYADVLAEDDRRQARAAQRAAERAAVAP